MIKWQFIIALVTGIIPLSRNVRIYGGLSKCWYNTIMSFASLVAAAQKSNYKAADDLFDSPSWSETRNFIDSFAFPAIKRGFRIQLNPEVSR